ncbi:MAG: hypothetical protein JWN33_137 [Candidatus Saccharibacteria bacterium]|nr:hypothetical protein [Candidatus Saccharibacteria bacterium]
MNVLVVFIALAVFLFLAAFLTKRRFGLLGLALAAGATLSMLWIDEAGELVAMIGLFPISPLTNAVTLGLLVLLPAILLLFHGYSYKRLPGRIIGATLFTLLALAFLVDPLQFALQLDGVGGTVYRWLQEYKDVIIGLGMVIAVVDLFLTKPAPAPEKKGKH